MKERMRDRDVFINAIFFTDIKAQLTYVNNSFLQLWGYGDEKEVLGKPAIKLWKRIEEAKGIFKTIHDKGSWAGELVARRKDGMCFNVQLSANIVKDDSGTPVCMVGSLVDSRDRKRADELLSQSRQDGEDIFNTIPDMITVHA